jgi:hypothetical protein
MPEAPQGALRAVFAGIGRILNITDKVRNKPADAGAPVNGTTTETAASKPAVPEPAVPETVASEPATPEAAASETSAAPETAEPEATTPETVAPGAAAELPLPNYDELTIASVRARLRNLSVAQLGELINYEKAHSDRADFIAMFERRIAKVESEK